ncbi:MAG: hypothetical protein ACF8NJ_04285, partial [Phycisphaerales bacterium JB038]
MRCRVELHKRTVRYANGVKVQYWTLRWYGANGKRYSDSIGKVKDITKSKAERLRREKEEAINTGQILRDKPRPITLKELIKYDKAALKTDVRPATLREIDIAGAHALAAWGGDVRLDRLSRADVGRLKSHLVEEKQLAPATV